MLRSTTHLFATGTNPFAVSGREAFSKIKSNSANLAAKTPLYA